MIDSVPNPEELDATGPETDTATEPPSAGTDSPPGSAEADAEDASPTAAEAGSETDAVDALIELQDEFDALNDRHLRLAAEFNNYRRRVEQERLDTWGRAQADFVEGILDVLDDLQRVAALDLSNASVEAIMEGIDLVEKKFQRKLADAGVEVVDPAPGTPFDPEIMEAMMRVPAADETVAQVMQKGYTLKGQLVRPARVGVHKHGA